MTTKESVAILGASNKPERYSFKALNLLAEHEHRVFPVHPALEEINGHKVYSSLEVIDEAIDTLTLYVGVRHIEKLIPSIVALNPKRVILNPGTESEPLKEALSENNIPYLEACTLIMLKTDQF